MKNETLYWISRVADPGLGLGGALTRVAEGKEKNKVGLTGIWGAFGGA